MFFVLMSAWWLLLIVPASMSFGALMVAFFIGAGRDHTMEPFSTQDDYGRETAAV